MTLMVVWPKNLAPEKRDSSGGFVMVVVVFATE
jgi:hypothetical protein